MPLPSIKPGDIFHTKNCGACEVLSYESSFKVKIQFIETGYITTTRSDSLQRGSVKDPLAISVCSVGYVGHGKFSNKTHPKIYKMWAAMLYRCYTDTYSAYSECHVSKRWHNFQNFCQDILKMPYHDKEGFELDKDLKIPGNKIYGRRFCSFVPQQINLFCTKRVKSSALPTGVTKVGNKYTAKIYDGKQISLGMFETPELARDAYVEAKVKIAKKLLNKYKKFLDNDMSKSLISLAKLI